MTNFKQTFNIIKVRNSPNEAETLWGEKVERHPELFVIDYDVGGIKYTGFVPVLDYRSHFIYETSRVGYPTYLCTCGGFGVIVASEAFKEDTSQTGLAIVCYHHHIAVDERTGKKLNKHADGSYG